MNCERDPVTNELSAARGSPVGHTRYMVVVPYLVAEELLNLKPYGSLRDRRAALLAAGARPAFGDRWRLPADWTEPTAE